MRIFGWMKYLNQKEFEAFLAKFPPDVVDAEFTLPYFASQLQRTARPIKVALLEQSYFGGIGNIYANDALWKVRLTQEDQQELSKEAFTLSRC